MRKNLEKLHDASKEKGGYIVRTAAQGAEKEDFEREIAYLHKLHEVLERRSEGRRRAVADLPGGRPADPRPPRRPRQRVRRRRDRRPEAVRAGDLVLPADRAGARRLGRDALARRAPVRALRRRGGVPLDALAAGRPALRRLPDHRLRRGADRDRHQHRQLHRQGQGAARGHDHEGQRRGGRRGRPPAPAARHRRDHRHRLHRHGAGQEPRPGAEDAAQGARRGPDQDLRRRGLAARAGRDDPPERHRRRPRDPDDALPDLRRRGRRPLGRDGRDRGAAQAPRRRRADRRRRT